MDERGKHRKGERRRGDLLLRRGGWEGGKGSEGLAPKPKNQTSPMVQLGGPAYYKHCHTRRSTPSEILCRMQKRGSTSLIYASLLIASPYILLLECIHPTALQTSALLTATVSHWISLHITTER